MREQFNFEEQVNTEAVSKQEQPIIKETEEKTAFEKIKNQAKKIAKIGALSFLTMAGPGMASESSAKGQETKRESIMHEETVSLDDSSKIVFQYNKNKEIVGLTSSFKNDYESQLNSKELLKDNWSKIVEENVKGTQEYILAETAIKYDSLDVYNKKKVIKQLINLGKENSPEVNFLKKDISETVKIVENKYGDIFK